jgi:hypothetical protein
VGVLCPNFRPKAPDVSLGWLSQEGIFIVTGTTGTEGKVNAVGSTLATGNVKKGCQEGALLPSRWLERWQLKQP